VFTAVGGNVDVVKLAVEWAIAGDNEPLMLEHLWRANMRLSPMAWRIEPRLVGQGEGLWQLACSI